MSSKNTFNQVIYQITAVSRYNSANLGKIVFHLRLMLRVGSDVTILLTSNGDAKSVLNIVFTYSVSSRIF